MNSVSYVNSIFTFAVIILLSLFLLQTAQVDRTATVVAATKKSQGENAWLGGHGDFAREDAGV